MKSFPGHVIATLLLGFMAGACGANATASVGPGSGGNDANGGSTGENGGNSTASGGATTIQTGIGGTSNAGGSVATGGKTATGGTDSVTGGSKTTGGSKAAGGSVATGGAKTTGGSAATGGSKATGGSLATGGSRATGGSVTTGGTRATGGSVATGGSKPTGGTTATGGTKATGGTTATGPRSCTFPSSWNVGSATYTYYSLPNATTACGYNGSNNSISNIANGQYFAAIPGNNSSDFNTSNRCGACIQINNTVITIVDECPNDSNPPCQKNPNGHLDLSQAATSAAGVQGDPNLSGQAQWKYVPCPVNGNVKVRLKPGNNNEFFIENVILPIQSVNCGGQTGSRTSYGAWHFGNNVNGTSCTATDIGNSTITFTVGSQQGQDVDSGAQFQKCN